GAAPGMGGRGGGASASDAAALEEVIVSGTRIRRDDFRSVTASQNISAEDMERLGLISAADMLAQMPDNVGSFELDPNDSAFNVGATLANLRGMNTGLGTRTLTLVDGRRMVVVNDGSGVDLNFVPSALVSRLETVTGGAS